MRGQELASQVEQPEVDYVRINLVGAVNDFGLARQLGGCIRPGQDRLLLVDCLGMVDYTPEARQLFIDWNRAHKRDIGAVAVVTQKTLWHLVVSAMALASGQRMKPFYDLDAALWWLAACEETHQERTKSRRA